MYHDQNPHVVEFPMDVLRVLKATLAQVEGGVQHLVLELELDGKKAYQDLTHIFMTDGVSPVMHTIPAAPPEEVASEAPAETPPPVKPAPTKASPTVAKKVIP